MQEESCVLSWRRKAAEMPTNAGGSMCGAFCKIEALPNAGGGMCVELGKNYPAMDSGEIRIRQLGYKQELRRNFTLVSNASIGFTAISILTGITGKSACPTRSVKGLCLLSKVRATAGKPI